jgi:hypothetical protein
MEAKQDFISSWLTAVRDVKRLSGDYVDSQQDFIEFLRTGPKHRQELLKIATAAARTEGGLVVRYGARAIEYYRQQAPGQEEDHPYLFHGTGATWDIVESGKLISSEAGHGTGIYFGRNYQTSVPFAFNRYEDHEIRSIMILHNDQPVDLIARDWEHQRTYEYFLEGRQEYSIDSLVAIVFAENKDVRAFDYKFRRWPKAKQEEFLARGVKLYDQSLRPLDYDSVFNAFSRVFRTIPEVLDVDPELAFWPVGLKSFHLYSNDLYELLLYSTKGDRDLVKRVIRSALWDTQYTFIKFEVIRKLTGDEWWDLLTMGQDGGYKEELKYTLLWLMLKDEDVRAMHFEDFVKGVSKERLREWMKKNKWLVNNEDQYRGSHYQMWKKWDILKKLTE